MAATTLRAMVILELVLILGSVILSEVLSSRLPPALQAWLELELERDLAFTDWTLVVVGLPTFIALIVASLGLLLLQRWAAWLYLCVTCISVALMPLGGPVVEHALAVAVEEGGLIIAGVILGIAFFSDALSPPESRPLPVAPPA